MTFEQFATKGTASANSGVTVHWLALADLSAAAALSEGFDPTAYALSAGDQTATLTQYGKFCAVLKSSLKTWKLLTTLCGGVIVNVRKRLTINYANYESRQSEASVASFLPCGCN